MKGEHEGHEPAARVWGKQDGASFQVIILGSSGGPREDTITGLLVRSTASEWRKGSVIAVDAGAHLAKIIRILEQEHGLPWASEAIPDEGYSQILTDGPFAGIKAPGFSAKAVALYIFRELLHSFLITHPHLDHVSGMGINTPALEYGREAKAIVALPSTIDAIKNHIFNDIIWPNLSDEGNGVGFVTYRRLVEGGNPRLGVGEGRGYVNVCDGLATKCWSVSHGRCRRHSHSISHQRDGSFGFPGDGYPFTSRRISQVSDGYINAIAPQPGFPRTPGAHTEVPDASNHFQPVDSSAFFIRNDSNGHEIIVFGDIEPDSVSLYPRNQVVWEDAAPKILSGTLKAIFIECSYDDSVRDEDLYGHLCPRHLIAELRVLAEKVTALTRNQQGMNLQEPPSPGALRKKRKRDSDISPPTGTPSTNNGSSHLAPTSPKPSEISGPIHSPSRRISHTHRTTRTPNIPPYDGTPQPRPDPAKMLSGDDHLRPLTPTGSVARPDTPGRHQSPLIRSHTLPATSQGQLSAPLKGLTVHVIHVKDTLADGPSPREVILRQLTEQAEVVGLGCLFDVTSDGESIWI